MLSLIVATDSKNGIGKAGGIPWVSRPDMKHFKESTMGFKVLMGFNTFKSLNYKPLPGRDNIVILDMSRPVPVEVLNSGCTILPYEGVHKYLEAHESEQMYLIGGAALYTKYIEQCSLLVHTSIMGDYECDAFFDPLATQGWNFELQQVLMDGSVVRYYSK